jgi:hypothetical protein
MRMKEVNAMVESWCCKLRSHSGCVQSQNNWEVAPRKPMLAPVKGFSCVHGTERFGREGMKGISQQEVE